MLNVFEQCKTDSQTYEKQLKDSEGKENDILHELEGVADYNNYKKQPPKYKRRAVLSTQLQNVLINRRIAKDYIRLYQPIMDFITSDTGTKAINLLKVKLGDIRKTENEMSIRRYYRRSSAKTKT